MEVRAGVSAAACACPRRMGMDSIGLFANVQKPGAGEVTADLAGWLEGQGIMVFLSRETAIAAGRERGEEGTGWLGQVDMLIVLGGDGTLLHAAKQAAPYGTPILGVNLGHLGFLTEIELSDLYGRLPEILAGRYEIESRMMLSAKVVAGCRPGPERLALNDVVVAKGPFARLVEMDTFVNDILVDTYPADGLIISTATGSTAYSLSAGGPIISPAVDAIILTPICPHTLYSRSVVIAPDDRVRVAVRGKHHNTMVTLDGQEGIDLGRGEEVVVRRAAQVTRLVRGLGWTFYDVLRKKLREGQPARNWNGVTGE